MKASSQDLTYFEINIVISISTSLFFTSDPPRQCIRGQGLGRIKLTSSVGQAFVHADLWITVGRRIFSKQIDQMSCRSLACPDRGTFSVHTCRNINSAKLECLLKYAL